MEKEISILVIGAHEEILTVILRLLNKMDNWNAIGVNSCEELIKQCSGKNFRVVLLGGGLSAEQEQAVKQYVIEKCPDTTLVPHYGGGSGLLYAEIYGALKTA
ncbi:hypothetical protein [Pedobacter antarcticus]|uniref:hypothetical protein n=1 Tax=Pedobacter antarcticus TaxID=34086 RepID=UPI0008909D64|nr:hypothetical protein [Pedobacter antarcticus]SDL50951.1 hypothetical protein SAMN04488084_101526 [Pedobacter antarcticus]